MANIKCTGKEDRLEDCSIEKVQHTPGHEVCSKATSVAGVICDARKYCPSNTQRWNNVGVRS